jgi:hypothetical protein
MYVLRCSYNRNSFPPHYQGITEVQLPGELFQEAVSVEYALQQPVRAPPSFILVLDLSQSLEALTVRLCSLPCSDSHNVQLIIECNPAQSIFVQSLPTFRFCHNIFASAQGQYLSSSQNLLAGDEAKREADVANAARILLSRPDHLWSHGHRCPFTYFQFADADTSPKRMLCHSMSLHADSALRQL